MFTALLIKSLPLLERFHTYGHDAYIVGGAVRDLFLRRPIQDIDIVTSASVEDIHALFPNAYQINRQHETVTVKWQQQSFEVTTKRGQDLVSDLERRDFTINSIALDRHGTLVDPVQGQKDIKEKSIRSFKPEERMKEDPLRILRALRFCSELGFGCHSGLQQTIAKLHPLLLNVATERIVKEFERLIAGPYRFQAMQLLLSLSVWRSLPQFDWKEESIGKLAELPLPEPSSPELRWSAISLCLDWKDSAPLKQLLLSNQLKKAVNEYRTYFTIREQKSWTAFMLYQASLPTALEVEQLRTIFGKPAVSVRQLTNMWEELAIHHRSELALNGHDLMIASEQPAGRWIKQELELAEKVVIEKLLPNEKHVLLAELERRRFSK